MSGEVTTFGEMVKRLGGAARITPAIGAPAGTIRQWCTRKSVPARYFEAIADAARRQGQSIDHATLAKLADWRRA